MYNSLYILPEILLTPYKLILNEIIPIIAMIQYGTLKVDAKILQNL